MIKSIVKIALLIIIFSNSCKKAEDNPFIPLDKEFKRYFTTAGEGSMYIFLDTVNNISDTTIITEKFHRNNFWADSEFDEEQYKITYSCTKTLDFFTEIHSNINYKNDTIYYFRVRVPDAPSSHIGLEVSLENGKYIAKDGEVNLIDSLKVMNETYFNLIEIIEKGSANSYKKMIFAKDIGVILKETSSIYGYKTYLLKKYILK